MDDTHTQVCSAPGGPGEVTPSCSAHPDLELQTKDGARGPGGAVLQAKAGVDLWPESALGTVWAARVWGESLADSATDT